MRIGHLASITAIIALAGVARADITDPALRIWASDGQGGWGQVTISNIVTQWVDGHWEWQSAGPIAIPYSAGGTGNVGMLDSLTLSYVADPIVGLDFVVSAGVTPTHFVITSGLLSFPAFLGVGNASAGVSVTDADNNGTASLTGNHPGGNAYLPQYNGFVPGGTTFISPLVTGPVLVTTIGGTTVASGAHDATPIGALVANMSSQWDFTLSAFDSAAGTSTFRIVVPGPGAAATVVVGLGLAAVRRRR